MKVFLSALEGAHAPKSQGSVPIAKMLVERGVKMRYNLMSYYVLDKSDKKKALAKYIHDHSDEIMIDSGAHSFQGGKKVDWDAYTERYAEFIKAFDSPKVVGFFEMDVDLIIGLPKVEELRARLERVSDKIIPVWHKNRGIEDFKRMCESHKGRVVSITGFSNSEFKDSQYPMFLRYARKCGCRMHCLGMTRSKVLDKVPFDYTDSSSWLQRVMFGVVSQNTKQRATMDFCREHREELYIKSYINALKDVEHYEERWSHVKPCY